MIKFLNINDKDMVKIGKQKKNVLFKINIKKDENKRSKRVPLNISLAIDTSSSMNDYVSKEKIVNSNNKDVNAIDYLRGFNFNKLEVNNKFETKLSKVKNAALECLDMLEDGDYISIITFDYNAKTIQDSIVINAKNKILIKEKINSIYANGGTNLHDGWLKAGIEVAKKLDKKKINRVLILTDGETNQGIVNPEEIVKNIEGLAERGVSTSTFGVGDHYNEDLLERIANISGGNAYYIESDKDVSKMLAEEFLSLNNIIGSDATIEINTNKDIKFLCLNDLEQKDNTFKVGNLISGKEVAVVFQFDFNVKMNIRNVIENFNLGKVTLKYKNKNGEEEVIKLNLDYQINSEEIFTKEKSREEVEVQVAILDLAKKQRLAKEEFAKGNRKFGYDMLQGAMRDAEIYANNSKVAQEIGQMQNLVDFGDNYSNEKMSKTLSSMSYSTRTSKR